MIINHIALRNFKCFANVELHFSKLTLLTGENSSGKSSLLYGILAAFQSQEFPFFLSPNGDYINMGDFVEMSFNNSKSNLIGIDFIINTNKNQEAFNISTNWAFNSINNMPKLHSLEFKSSFYDFSIKVHSELKYILDLYFKVPKDKTTDRDEMEEAFLELAKKLDRLLPTSKSKRKENLVERMKAFHEIKNINNLSIDSLDDLPKKVLNTGNLFAADRIGRIKDEFRNIDSNINYISSFRLQPERTYYQKMKANAKVGTLGENHIDQILEWEEKDKNRFKILKSTLNSLNLLRTMKTTQLKGGRYEFRVQVRNKGVWALLTDVGFGISQFLPILVADLQLSKKSTLMVAQPEIHLHPSVQASLSDYFINQVTKNSKRYIIETHSEYLLNRVRLSIAKGTISPSDVSVYFFENSLEGSKTHNIKFTKDGKILNAPKKFFETYMIDVMEIAMHS